MFALCRWPKPKPFPDFSPHSTSHHRNDDGGKKEEREEEERGGKGRRRQLLIAFDATMKAKEKKGKGKKKAEKNGLVLRRTKELTGSVKSLIPSGFE